MIVLSKFFKSFLCLLGAWKRQKRAIAQQTMCVIVIVVAAAIAVAVLYCCCCCRLYDDDDDVRVESVKLDGRFKFSVKFDGIRTQIYVSADAFYR